MFLEAAQQGGQARSTPDRDDPRAAGEESLLVDELDQGLVPVTAAERIRKGPAEPDGATDEDGHADERDDQAADRVWQGLQRQCVQDGSGQSARIEVAGRLPKHVRECERQEQEPYEHHQEPPLDPDPGRQPAPQVHARSSSRWKTATGPGPSWFSQAASSSAMTMERW